MQRFPWATLILSCALGWPALVQADPPQSAKQRLIDRVCNLIQAYADQNGLPRDFFARLIWKESRFDPNAVSPVGAEGIAQFMPGTAKMRGLENSFDITQAIPASAKYLAEMKTSYGNLGLAAAAYNAGENRVSRWLASGGFLPMETESYVFDIMGEPVDKFSDRAYGGKVEPLDAKTDFAVACRKLPVIMSRTVAMASINVKPWGIQVAGNFRRGAAINQWLRVRSRFPALLASHDPVVSRVRTPMGRRGIYAVRIGVDDRAVANVICQKLQSVGGACVVVRNR
ncbi:lytic transglycosylase domain-containing protein [Mesorhizobium sp. B2-4-14]|uniref:lytic transglycosylase domain-containing protein n=1 Tax=Mesorhizobium sp. B2-4-14 TaxID=2589935 RepID=UPI001127FDFF|nr:lytic transglycosylase domain-containing protein [Mesorhizobium sp. B2-4-14]TPK95177.1 lytic transglycosylase domain-containing protein [Mesorhizobium sp. B2-4-14]